MVVFVSVWVNMFYSLKKEEEKKALYSNTVLMIKPSVSSHTDTSTNSTQTKVHSVDQQ